jgi:hypothetical protein
LNNVTKPIGRSTLFKKGPLTAERQKRHRKKLKAVRSAEVRRRIANRQWEEEALQYRPAHAGITYYRMVTMKPGELVTLWQPERRPGGCLRPGDNPENKRGDPKIAP